MFLCVWRIYGFKQQKIPPDPRLFRFSFRRQLWFFFQYNKEQVKPGLAGVFLAVLSEQQRELKPLRRNQRDLNKQIGVNE